MLKPDSSLYDRVFESEALNTYPEIDAYEKECDAAIDRELLLRMARILNCPVKRNPPNWQHGRVIHAALTARMRSIGKTRDTCAYLDIGTAKGFSAVVMVRALTQFHQRALVHTAEVVDLSEKIRRNTVAELDGYKSVWELIEPFVPSVAQLAWVGDSFKTLELLRRTYDRIPFAFVDGKHDFRHVRQEAVSIAAMQREGDVILFDDCQMPEVFRAVQKLRGYDQRVIDIGVRKYVIATKRRVWD